MTEDTSSEPIGNLPGKAEGEITTEPESTTGGEGGAPRDPYPDDAEKLEKLRESQTGPSAPSK